MVSDIVRRQIALLLDITSEVLAQRLKLLTEDKQTFVAVVRDAFIAWDFTMSSQAAMSSCRVAAEARSDSEWSTWVTGRDATGMARMREFKLGHSISLALLRPQ